MKSAKLWNHFDDWANAVLLVAQFVVFGFLFIFIARIVTVETEVMPYSLGDATAEGRSCKLQNFNPNCVSGFSSLILMPCSGCTLPLVVPNDLIEFKYLWYNSGFSTTTCRDRQIGSVTANNALDMGKWDDPAITAANRAANQWMFAFDSNKNTTVTFGGPQTFDLQVPTTQANSYPKTPWNSFNIDLIDALSRYQQLVGVQISSTDNFNIESIVAKLAPLELRLAGMPSTTAGGPAYNMDMTRAMQGCNQGLQMTCQSLSPEPTFDYILRLFGYTVIIQILFGIAILIQHVVKARKSQVGSSQLHTPLLQNAYRQP